MSAAPAAGYPADPGGSERVDGLPGETVDVVVVGAGISGLVVAFEAVRAGLQVVVVERAAHTGGLLRRGELGGTPVDLGAESFATRTSGVSDLIAEAGLDLTIVAPTAEGAHLAAEADDGLVLAPLPQRTVLGIPADPMAPDVVRILGEEGARRVAAEPVDAFSPFGSDAQTTEPSLARLVADRCGETLVRRLVDPLCRSVYSTPAAELRLSRVHPAMWREFRARGSLIAAADAVAPPTRTGSAVAGIAGGIWQLASHLEQRVREEGVRVQVRTQVQALTPVGAEVEVTTDTGVLRARRVVVATGAAAAARLLDLPSAARSAVRVVAARVDSVELNAHPVGSGVIVAHDVPSAAKALTHVTAKWDWAAQSVPAGTHLVRLSAREAGAPGLETAADVAREVTTLTGVAVSPSQVTAVTSVVWDDALAGDAVDPRTLTALAHQGIVIAGAPAAGTGLASIVPHARRLALDLIEELAAPTAAHTPTPNTGGSHD